jgi:CMP/dCMP kinase
MKYLESDKQHPAVNIIERHLRLWTAHRQTARKKLNEESRSGFQFLTIARDGGSLGNEIAQELSRRLEWHVFDKEIVTYIAENSHVRENLVSQLDQKSRGLVQDMISHLLMPESSSFGVAGYHVELLRTLAYIAAQGAAIIVGRGANFALRDDGRGLFVRLTASSEVRIQRLSRSWKVNPEEAHRRMQADDKERREFIRQYFRQDFDDMRFYDLIFNTDRLSIKQIATSILTVINRPQSETTKGLPHGSMTRR